MSTATGQLHLLVRVDADATTGLGHAVRTAGVISAIELPLSLTVVGAGDALPTFFPGARICPCDDRSLDALAAEYAADAVLVDLPEYQSLRWEDPRPGTPLIVIDDWGGPLEADLIINGTVLERYHHYPAMADQSRLLCGPQYALVRPAFAAQPWRAEASRGVTLVVGSGTRSAVWTFRMTGDHVDRSAWQPFFVVASRSFPDPDRLAQQCKRAGATLNIGITAEALALRLATSRVALLTGGMVVYEALATNTPSVVFPLLENMVPEAAWLASRGCIHDLGFDGGMNPAAVSFAVSRLLSHLPLAKDMAMRARQVIDGRGMARAAAAVTRLLHAAGRKGA